MMDLPSAFTSVYIWTPAIGWFTAQFIKIIISLIRDHHFQIGMLMSSGGMPSSHSSTVVSLTTCVGVMEGTGSSVFATLCILSFIVMYDATGVRRETGRQAQLLNKLTSDLVQNKTKYLDRDLKELVGHTPIQVIAGAVLGILIGYLVPNIWAIFQAV